MKYLQVISRVVVVVAVIVGGQFLIGYDRATAARSISDIRSLSSLYSRNAPKEISATVFTSTTSGSWGNPATWGGVGVPGSTDSVVISGTTNVTLDITR